VTNLKSGLAHLHWSTLSTELATLRASVDELSAAFSEKYGRTNDVVQRTAELSAAIRRLEWAISQQQLQNMSATSGA
jgi:hypothetical protein